MKLRVAAEPGVERGAEEVASAHVHPVEEARKAHVVAVVDDRHGRFFLEYPREAAGAQMGRAERARRT